MMPFVQIGNVEQDAGADFVIRGLKIGGGSRMKVLAEIMDAHRCEDIREVVERYFHAGADIVDLGFGFDATPEDVTRVFSLVGDIDRPLAVDTQDPALIRAALVRADIVLSLQEDNIPHVGKAVADAGAAAVIVPGNSTLAKNISRWQSVPVLDALSPIRFSSLSVPGLYHSLKQFQKYQAIRSFLGRAMSSELLDADSVGANALLAGMAKEVGASVIFSSEHSDKTHGSISEMRRATEMMVLAEGSPLSQRSWHRSACAQGKTEKA